MNPDLMKDFLLKTFPNPERKGCPAEDVIQALAEEKLPANDPIGLHIASCSECYAEYRHYRKDWEEMQAVTPRPQVGIPTLVETTTERSSKPWRSWIPALAASLIVTFSVGFYAFNYSHHHHQTETSSQIATSKPVDVHVDLFESGTFRGTTDATIPLNQVTLPSAIVHLSVVLPRFSDAGAYRVNISTDKAGSPVISSATGNAVEVADGKVLLDVTLDLRTVKPGTYFFATVRGSDNGTYYYPLTVR